MVYQGTTGGLVEHMKGLGVKIDRFKNPADTFIKILGTCKNNNKKLKMFMRAYDRDIIDSVRSEQGYYTFDQLMKIDLGSDKQRRPSNFSSLWTLFHRNVLGLWRNPGSLGARVAQTIFIAIVADTLYYDLG